MKKTLLFIVSFFIMSIAFSQQGINYKAIISDNGEVLKNKSIDVQFTILENGLTSVYIENHNAVTDNNGIVILNIGEGNTELGDFSGIDWSKELFLKVEIDTGDGYIDFGITGFKAVPYAKYAEKAANTFSGKFSDLTEVPEDIANGDDNTQLTEEQVDEYVENNGYIDVEVDGSTENELQVLTLNDHELTLSHNGRTVVLPNDKDDWGNQTIVTNNTLSGSGTNENPLGVTGDLTDNQSISGVDLEGDSLTIGIENGSSQTVDLSPLKDGTGSDNQNITDLSLSENTLTVGIERGNSQTVDLSSLKDGTGTDSQNISGSGLNGSILTIGIENGSSEEVDLSPLKGSDVEKIDDLDDAKTNLEGSAVYLGKSAGENIKEFTENHNVALGYESLQGSNVPINNTGNNNIALGYQSLSSNSTGSFNTAAGFKSLHSNTTGEANTAIGQGALFQNKAGNGATAIGFNSMINQNNSSESFENHNTAVGYKSLAGVYPIENNTGNDNTALGNNALTKNSSGNDNIAIGVNSLKSNKTGSKNIAIGNATLYNNDAKGDLIAIGDSALYNNGLNSNNYDYGRKNIAIGSKSMLKNTTGNRNIAIGFNTMKTNISGVSNTIIGSEALNNSSIGNQNVCIGEKTLHDSKVGSRNTAIGYQAGYKGNGSGNVFIGNKAGYNETGDFKLYIDNTYSSKPLIGGDFFKNIATINGKLGINTDSPEARLHVKGDVKISATLKTDLTIYSNSSVQAKNNFTYKSPKTYYYQIHPLDFKIKYGDGYTLKVDEKAMWIKHESGSGWFDGEAYAQVRLPENAVIQNVRYYYRIGNNGSGSASFQIALFRKDITSSPVIEVMGNRSHNSGFLYEPHYINNIIASTVDNNRYQYVIKVFMNEIAGSGETDDVSFFGATIEYTLDKVSQ